MALRRWGATQDSREFTCWRYNQTTRMCEVVTRERPVRVSNVPLPRGVLPSVGYCTPRRGVHTRHIMCIIDTWTPPNHAM